jgi:hypothetical protein
MVIWGFAPILGHITSPNLTAAFNHYALDRTTSTQITTGKVGGAYLMNQQAGFAIVETTF